MWMRIRLKIGWPDLVYGAVRSIFPGQRTRWEQELKQLCAGGQNALASYSVRSGFDLAVQALDLPAKSEILFSALNIPEMGKIAEWHDLVPVPVDLDFDHMAPRKDALEKAVTNQTKVIVVAHLFGARIDMGQILEFARKHKLLVIEDCAQCFDGPAFTGHPQSDMAMFSFGQIKTSTALGGAVFRIKDRALCDRMAELQSKYPVKGNLDFFTRVLKFSVIKIVTTRPVMALIYRAFSAIGKDYEEVIAGPVRRVAVLNEQKALMYQSATAMLAMMCRRIRNWPADGHAKQIAKAKTLHRYLDSAVATPATKNNIHGYWVFPVVVKNRGRLKKTLRRYGFDTADVGTLPLQAPEDRPQLAPTVAQQVVKNLLVLPCYPQIPDRELLRLAQAVKRETQNEAAEMKHAFSGEEAVALERQVGG